MWRHSYGGKPLIMQQIPKNFQVEMAKRDDQKRKQRELDLNMRWGDSKDGKDGKDGKDSRDGRDGRDGRDNRDNRDGRDRVRDRGRSRSEERTSGLYAIAPLATRNILLGHFPKTIGKVRVGFLNIILCICKKPEEAAIYYKKNRCRPNHSLVLKFGNILEEKVVLLTPGGAVHLRRCKTFPALPMKN